MNETPTELAAEERRSRVKELHSEGFMNNDIARSLRCTRNTVRKDLLVLGLLSNGLNRDIRKNAPGKPPETLRLGRPRNEDTILLAKRALHEFRETFDEVQVAILEMVVEGKRNREIAYELGLKGDKIDNTLAGCKLRFKKTGVLSKTRSAIADRRESVKELHDQGLYSEEIASRLRISRQTVGRDLAAMGLESNGLRSGGMPREWEKPDLFSKEEAQKLCKEWEKKVILRRLARGMTVSDMMAVDGSDRQFVLDQFTSSGVPIPEGEAWVGKPGEKLNYVPSRRMRRDTTTIQSKDTWNTKARV